MGAVWVPMFLKCRVSPTLAVGVSVYSCLADVPNVVSF